MIARCPCSSVSTPWLWSRENYDIELVLAGETNLLGRADPQTGLAGVQATVERADVALLLAEEFFAESSVQARRPDIPHKPTWLPNVSGVFPARWLSAIDRPWASLTAKSS